ncbi:hypothetical protein ACQCVP_18010 [Rossellomorea vietnamensis]
MDGRLNQVMYRVCLMLVLLLLLSGCRIEMSLNDSPPATGTTAQSSVPASGNTSGQNESLSIFINGDIEYDESQLNLKAYTNLQEGALLKVILRAYPKEASLREIFNDEVQPAETPVVEKLIEVDSKGESTLTLERQADIVYFLVVRFNPELQPDEIKEVYGARGEKVVVASNVEHYEHEGETMIGVTTSATIGMRPSWAYLQ